MSKARMRQAQPLSAAVKEAQVGGLSPRRRLAAVAAISCGLAVIVIDGNIANVALPTICRELKVTPSQSTGVVMIYQLVQLMCLLPLASVADRIGYRRFFVGGLMVFMLSSGLCYLASDFSGLLVLRGFQGLGASIVMSVNVALVRATYPPARLGMGMGLNSVIVASAGAIAPTLGGFILTHFAWQFIFVCAVPLTLPALLLASALPETPASDHRPRLKSGVLSAVTLLLLVGGLQLSAHPGLRGVGFAIAIAGAFAVAGLFRMESRTASPVLPVDLLKIPQIGLSALGALSGFLAVGVLMIFLPFQLEQRFHLGPADVGLVLLTFPLTLLVIAPIAGAISDRASPSKVGVTGLTIATVGISLLALMPDQATVVGISARLALCALGFGMFLPPNSRVLIGRTPVRRTAAAGSLLSTSRLLGQTFAAVAMGTLLSLGLGYGAAPLLVSMAFCIVAMGCCLTRLAKHNGEIQSSGLQSARLPGF